jgi:DNA invertase Pin-like site-specific DNA recombinase
MRLALYARVSSDEQNPDAQLAELRDYVARTGAEAIEHVDRGVSGRKDRRPQLDAMLEAVHRREVDAVVVVKLDRLARSVRHLCDLVADLEARGVALVVLSQGIDTRTSAGRFLFHTLAAVAELEADLIRERTLAGLAAARRRGARLGRPPALDAAALSRARRLLRSGKSVREVAKLLEVSRTAVARAAR